MKKLILLSLLLMAVASVQAASLRQIQLEIVDEFWQPVTNITQISVFDAGTSSATTIFSDRAGAISMTNPITTGSSNTTFDQSLGFVRWFQRAPDYKVTITNGTKVLTIDNRTGSVTRFPWFDNFIGTASSLIVLDNSQLQLGTDSDFLLTWNNASSFAVWTPAADDSRMDIGSTAATSDLNLYGGTSGADTRWDASEDTWEFDDDAILAVGDGDDWTVSHNGTTTTVAGAYTTSGIVTHSVDVIFDGTNDVKWDDNRFQLHFQDDAILGIGGAADAAGDVTLSHDGSNFSILSAIDDEGFLIGSTTEGFDITYAFETAGQIRTDWDADFINLTDDMNLRFGTGASANGDFQISSSSGNVLTIGQVAAGVGTIAIGVDDAGIDTTFYGDTTLINALWDTDADSWYFTGAATYLTVEGATVDGSEHVISFTDPTADIIWTFPDGGADTVAVMASTLATNYPEVANSVTGGTNQLIFEGTVDAHEHVITGTDATADVVWTLADGGASTVSFMASTLATNFPDIANSVTGGTNQLIFEGTADTEETIVTANDASTADATIELPNDSGDIVYAPIGAVDYAAGAGALPITHVQITYASQGGAEALTIPNGQPGQILQINHDSDGGNGVVTPDTATGYTSIDLADDGDMVTFLYVDTVGWIILGTAGNAAPPVVTP